MIAFLLTRLSRGVTRSLSDRPPPRKFLLTRLSRGVTRYENLTEELAVFLLTRLSRGVTITLTNIHTQVYISTHTPLARRDAMFFQHLLDGNFYSHASREA